MTDHYIGISVYSATWERHKGSNWWRIRTMANKNKTKVLSVQLGKTLFFVKFVGEGVGCQGGLWILVN